MICSLLFTRRLARKRSASFFATSAPNECAVRTASRARKVTGSVCGESHRWKLQLGLGLGVALAVEAHQFSRRLLGDVLEEVVHLSSALVFLRAGLAALRRKEYRRESANAERGWDVVGGGVHLGDGDSWFVLELFCPLFVFRRQRLAVSAPRSVELDQNVALGIVHHFVKILTNGNFEGTGVSVGGKRFRLEVRLQISGEEVADKRLESRHVEVARHHELLVFLVLRCDDGLVSGGGEAEFVQLVRKVVLVGDGVSGRNTFLVQLLGDLHDAVPPVVGSLDVLDVVDVVEGGDERSLELVRVGPSALTAKTVG